MPAPKDEMMMSNEKERKTEERKRRRLLIVGVICAVVGTAGYVWVLVQIILKYYVR